MLVEAHVGQVLQLTVVKYTGNVHSGTASLITGKVLTFNSH